MNKKKLLRSTIIGFVLLLLALLVTGLFGISEGMNGGVGFLNANEYTYGLKATIGYFFQPWSVAHATGYIECVLVFMAALAVIALIILSIAKKKPAYIIPTLFLGASVAYLPFILLLVVPMVEMGVISMVAVFMMAVVAGLTLFAIYFFGLAVGDLIKEMLGALKKAAGDEFQEQRSEARSAKEGLSEEQVRAIVEEYLKEHVEEKHSEGEPAPGINLIIRFQFAAVLHKHRKVAHQRIGRFKKTGPVERDPFRRHPRFFLQFPNRCVLQCFCPVYIACHQNEIRPAILADQKDLICLLVYYDPAHRDIVAWETIFSAGWAVWDDSFSLQLLLYQKELWRQ